MLTAIEFFDKTPLENVISVLTTVPDKIIFIGDGKDMRRFDGIYRTFLEKRGLTVMLEYRPVQRNNITMLVEELSAIVEAEERCVFDLTGGDDLALVAVGMVYQKYRDEKPMQLQRLNVLNGVVTDCDSDGEIVGTDKPTISVEENICLHGGVIRYEEEGHAGTYAWELTADFVEDVELLWSVCRENPGLWNAQLNVLGAMSLFTYDDDPLSICVDLGVLQDYAQSHGINYVEVHELLQFFNAYGLIEDLEDDGRRVIFAYKNRQIKRCLSKAGTVLELKVFITARQLTAKEGTAYYTASMSGVFIDWDGSLHTRQDEEKDTENEIDVVLMQGLRPVFISCKNGQVDDDELYKLDAVTNRFGGRYAKKVLVATYLGKNGRSMEHFRQRAADMKIHLVDGVHEQDDAQFAKMVKHLING